MSPSMRFRRVLVINLGKGEKANIKLLFANVGRQLPMQLIVKLGEGSSLNLVEWHATGTDSNLFSGIVRELSLGDGASCNIEVLHNENDKTDVIENTKAYAQQNGVLKINYIYNGGKITRAYNKIYAEGGLSRIKANEIIFRSQRQKFDLNTEVINSGNDTLAELSSSAVAMQDSVCYLKGFARINNGAMRARSFVQEKGLLIGKGAKINSIPSMAIEENSVKATHSSTTGPIDKETVFYLMTKGISEANAKQLLASAFFSESIDDIENDVMKMVASSIISERIRGVLPFGTVPKMNISDIIWGGGPHHDGLEEHYKYRKEV